MLNSKSSNTESFKELFSLEELKEAIPKSHDTGIEIHFKLLRQLPPKSFVYLFTALNDTWKKK